MSTKVGDIFVSANLDRSQYNKGLGLMQKEAQKVGSTIGKKLGIGLGIAGLTAFIKKATDAGASLNAMGTIIDASLPNMTKQVNDFAKSAGAMFGLSETQAKGFVGKFASMASAMGYTEKQAYNMSTALTGLAGDVASYYHISSDDAFAKLGAVFTGETEALKQLGVVMTQNALDAFALEHGFGRVTSQMTELEKTTLRYQFVMDRLKLASGDFAKYANTWSGSIATIKLNWANFMATVGQGIINVLLPLLQVIARVSNALSALGSQFLAFTKRLMGIKTPIQTAFGKKTQSDLKSVGGGIGDVGSGLGGVGKSAKGAKKQVQALKKELLGFDKITKLQGEKGVSTGGAGTGGGGGISAGGIDFGDAESDVKTFSDWAKDYLANIQLPPALSLALKDLKNAFSGLFEVLKSAGKWAWDNILVPLGKWTINELAPASVKLLASAVNLVTNALKLIGTVLEPLWEPLIKPFFTFLGGVAVKSLNNLKTAFDFLSNVIIGVKTAFENFKPVAETVINEVKAKFDTFKTNIDTVLGDIKTAFDTFKTNVTTVVTNIKTAVFDAFKTNIDTVLTNIKTAFETFKTNVSTIFTSIKTTFDTFKTNVSTAIESAKGALEPFKTSLDNIKSAVGDVLSKWDAFKTSVGDGIKKVVLELENNLTGKLKGVKDSWNNFKKSLKSKTVKLTIKESGKKVLDKIKKAWDSVKNKKATITLGFKNAITKTWNAIADKVNNARNKSSLVKTLFPNPLPKLAQGGFVKANTPTLAMIGDNKHEGEIVAPESKLEAMARKVAGEGNTEMISLLSAILTTLQNQDNNVYLDGEQIKNNVVRRINNHTRATGQLELLV